MLYCLHCPTLNKVFLLLLLLLIQKLHYYGIRDTALNWFRSYLTKRTQYVECNGVSSSIKEIETGVPQGSILGPLLFIIYMNDIHTVSDNLNFILYADDTTLVVQYAHLQVNVMAILSSSAS